MLSMEVTVYHNFILTKRISMVVLFCFCSFICFGLTVGPRCKTSSTRTRTTLARWSEAGTPGTESRIKLVSNSATVDQNRGEKTTRDLSCHWSQSLFVVSHLYLFSSCLNLNGCRSALKGSAGPRRKMLRLTEKHTDQMIAYSM